MANNMFIKITTVDGDVEGESQVKGFEKYIELTGWSWNVTQTGSAGSGQGGSTGVVKIGDLTVTGQIDKSYPVLAQCAANGTHVKTAELNVCKTGGDLSPFLKKTLNGGIVSSVTSSGGLAADGTSIQLMTITLNFASIDFEHKPQKDDGSFAGSTTCSISHNQRTGGSK
ncbi:MAG: type VI secretion system tube protein Hcp [Polyangiaceae bacterium]|nr:type VI secretion system tube protein Hcp [Polyangiaceae bacterium]